MKTIDTVVAVFYRPSGDNFSESKYNEALKILNTKLKEVQDEHPQCKVLLMGDFNFNKDVVTWLDSEEGPLPLPISKDANTALHRGYESLTFLAEKYDLKQIVNKPTRRGEILDVIYTNMHDQVSECQVVSMAGISDHDLVKFHLASTPMVDSKKSNAKTLKTLASRINWKRANKELLLDELSRSDWETVVDTPPPEKVSEEFANAVCQAALAVKTPLFHTEGSNRENKLKQLIDKLNAEKLKLTRQNLHVHVTHTQKKRNEDRIAEINKTMEEAFSSKRKEEEDSAVTQIRMDPSAFY